MTSKKYYEKLIYKFLDELNQIKGNKIFKMLGYSFIALPKVFAPTLSTDTSWFVEKIIPFVKDKTFLEIGTGTGVIAALAELNKAKKVIATDINPIAIKNAEMNKKNLNLNFNIRIGDIFNPIHKNEIFDIIFWNHPFGCSEKTNLHKDIINLSVFDYKYKSLIKFLKLAKNHLNSDGKIFLGTSNIAKINFIKKLIKQENYSLTLLCKSIRQSYKNNNVKIDLRIYILEHKKK